MNVQVDPTALPVRNKTTSDENKIIYTIHHSIHQLTDGLTYEERASRVQHELLAKYPMRICNIYLLWTWDVNFGHSAPFERQSTKQDF